MGIIGLVCIAVRWMKQVQNLRKPPYVGHLSNSEIDRL